MRKKKQQKKTNWFCVRCGIGRCIRTSWKMVSNRRRRRDVDSVIMKMVWKRSEENKNLAIQITKKNQKKTVLTLEKHRKGKCKRSERKKRCEKSWQRKTCRSGQKIIDAQPNWERNEFFFLWWHEPIAFIVASYPQLTVKLTQLDSNRWQFINIYIVILFLFFSFSRSLCSVHSIFGGVWTN